MSPWLATKLAASSRASRTILSSRKELVMSEVALEVMPVARTRVSVVTTKLLANALEAQASRAAAPIRRRRFM